MSMKLQTCFIFASVVAAFAIHSNEDEEQMSPVFTDDDLLDETDSLNLLQASVEMIKVQSKATTADDHEVVASEYNVASELQCMGEAKVAVESTTANIAPTIPLVEVRDSVSQTTSDDPPGAGTLRLFLQFSICLVVLDGIRRSLQLQTQKASQPKAAAVSQVMDQPSQKNAAASESAWVDMVNAARNADECSFKEALGRQDALWDRVDAWGCTALHFAAVGGSVAIAEALLKCGAEIDAFDVGDETPLHFAAREGHASMCELLVGAGAHIDAVSKDGLTPLAAAGFANKEQTCRALACCGAGVAGMLSDAELPTLIVSQIVQQVFAA